jgi:hypothetical protein
MIFMSPMQSAPNCEPLDPPYQVAELGYMPVERSKDSEQQEYDELEMNPYYNADPMIMAYVFWQS